MTKVGERLIKSAKEAVEIAQSKRPLMYDPPSGWHYDFPCPYLPKPGETLAQTLLRDGYPQEELDRITWDGSIHGVRFFGGGDVSS